MASTSDKITDVRNAARPNIARVLSGRASGGNTLSCDDLSGWPTASKVHFVTYQIDSDNNPVAGTQLDCYGIVSGSDITSFTVVDGSDSGNQVNDVVAMLPTAAWGQDLADALMNEHNRDGSHSDITAGSVVTDSLTVETGTILPAGDIGTNDLADAAVTPRKMLGIDLFGVTSAVAGSVPTAGTGQFYMQSGTSVTTTNGAGGGAVSFPTAFPNGILSVVICDGDGNPLRSCSLINSQITASGFGFVSSVASVPVRINWIAIGF